MADWARDFGLTGLFLSAFVSSTLAPGGSEAVLVYLATLERFSSAQLVLVATVGNTLGALTTWGLGLLLAARYPPDTAHEPRRERAIAQLRRWGWPVLLLSWLPLIGDGLCFAAGWLRAPFGPSVFAIATGKALRYALLLWLTQNLVATP